MSYLYNFRLLIVCLVFTIFHFSLYANSVDNIDIELSIDVDGEQFDVYEEVLYTVTVVNTGHVTATGIVVSVPVPEGMAFTDSDLSIGSYFNWTGEWNIGTVEPGASETMELILFTKQDDLVVNCLAQVIAADQTDLDSSPNNAGANPDEDDEGIVTIYIGNDIPCSIDAVQVVTICDDNETSTPDDDRYSFALNINRTNGGDLFNISGDLTLNGIAYESASNIDASFLISEGSLTIDITDASNSNCKIEDVTIIPPSPCSINPIPEGVDLELNLSVGQSTYTQYEEVSYTLTVENKGSEDATEIEISLPKPEEMAFTSANPSTGDYSAWTGIWKIPAITSQSTEVLELVFYTKEEGNDITILAQVIAMEQDDIDSSPNNNTGLIPNEDDESAVTITTEGDDPVINECAITNAGLSIICEDNDTEDSADDTFRISLNPTGSNLGTTYSVSGDIIANNLPYGTDIQIGGTYPILSDAINIRLTDDVDAICLITIEVEPPSSCFGSSVSVNPVDYTANDTVFRYDGFFRPGVNPGYNPPWKDEQLAELAAGKEELGIKGVGAKSIRTALFGSFVEVYGYDHESEAYDYYESLDLKDLTCIVGFPAEWQRDQESYCEFGFQSEMFANLYDDIWDDGENGTPVNDNNLYALYLYKLVSLYKDHIRFWEIWNEPGFDYTYATAWQPPGNPGNWWDNNPDPCDYKLRAPIFHYVRTLRISWEIIKAMDPDAYVTIAGVGQPSFLDAILRNTDNPDDGSSTSEYPLKGGAYFDCMGFHSYPHFDGAMRYWDNDLGDFVYERHSDIGADGIIEKLGRYEEVLYSYGYDGETYPKKENTITEINLPRQEFENWIGSQEAQTNFLIKAVVTVMQNNIHQMHVFNLADKTNEQVADDPFEIMGLYRQLRDTEPYDYELNPEGIVYKTTNDILFGRRHDEERTEALNLPEGVRGGAFKNEDDEYVYVLWAATSQDLSEDAYAAYDFPGTLGLNQLIRRKWDYSETGDESLVNADGVNLSATPIFLLEPTDEIQMRMIPETTDREQLVINRIYPNPPVNEVTISIHSVEEEALIELFDVNGKLMLQKDITTTVGHNRISLNLSTLETGVYFAIVSDSKTNQQIRFVKQQP